MQRSVLIAFLALFILIQFFRPEKNTAQGPSPNDISTVLSAPKSVLTKLDAACFNCHSNHTRYPWYAEVAPISWWMAGHIRAGKKHLNFSEFATYPRKRQLHKLEKIAEAIEEGWMPLKSYKIMHPESALKKDEIKEISDWLQAAQADLQKRTY